MLEEAREIKGDQGRFQEMIDAIACNHQISDNAKIYQMIAKDGKGWQIR
jgi:hypothetical protein